MSAKSPVLPRENRRAGPFNGGMASGATSGLAES
jgi:hypothetical protein